MTRRLPHRIAAGAVAAAVAASAFVAASPALAAPAEGTAPVSGPVDYFADRVEGLREGSVFESVTFERLEFLLQQDGRFPIVIGGPGDGRFDAVAAEIDAAARQQGVEKVYTFDPRVGGDTFDVRTTDLQDVPPVAATDTRPARPELRTTRHWDRIVNDYLNRDATPLFDTAQDPSSDPYLFVYDGGDHGDRIDGALSGAPDLGDATGYRAQVADVLEQSGEQPFAVSTQFDFFGTEVNRRHIAQYPDAARFGDGDIFTAADEQDFTLQSINYAELQHLLESDEEHVILFGGTWCHNTRAIIGEVNSAAREAEVDTVYVFDLRLDGTSVNNWHIRDSNSAFSHLYGDLVAQHLPGLKAEYPASSGAAIGYHPGGDTAAPRVTAPRLQVPYLVQYDGASEQPIVQEWIRDNGDGSYKEYMTEWWWVNGLPGSRPGNLSDEAWAAQQRQQWDFADEAIAKIDRFFDSSVSLPAAPAKPTASASGADVTVTWTAPAGETGTRSTGYNVSLNGGTAVRLAAGTTSYTFTGLAAGEYTATVVARNGLGASTASAASDAARVAEVVPGPETPGPETPAPTTPLPETGEPSELQLSVSGDLRAGGRIEVVGSGYHPEVGDLRVELHSTPSLLGTPSVASDGTFRLSATIPSSVPAGAHSVVVYVGGVEVSRTAVTIAAAAPGSSLANTGADAALGLGIGTLALLALGTALVLRRRTA